MLKRCSCILVLLLTISAVPAEASILQTKHNFSKFAPAGNVYRSDAVDEVCIFCHTPHNANPQTTGLWSRELSSAQYTLYPGPTEDPRSSLEADPAQPTGSSKLCLSCHDGTIAVGDYYGRLDDPSLGAITGRTLIGTNLSVHHPVSIRLVAETEKPGTELVNPMLNPLANAKLEGGRVECGSCHDPHKNAPSFLRTLPDDGQLCTECHQQTGWIGSAHQISGAVWNGRTVGRWACLGCHTVHNAVGGTRLLRPSYNPRDGIYDQLEDDPETGACLNCHNGTIPGVPDIRGEFQKEFKHNLVGDPVHYPHEFEDGSFTVAMHVECVDCHDPHRVRARTDIREIGDHLVGPELEGVMGLKNIRYGTVAWQAPTAEIGRLWAIEGDQEAGLCLKCHSSQSPMSFDGRDYMKAMDIFFNPNNWATHGCIVPSKNRKPQHESYVYAGLVKELREKWDGIWEEVVIACSDCHGNDDTGEDRIWGPHGSNWGKGYVNGETPRWLLRTATIPSHYDDGEPVPADTDPIVCYLCHDINVYGPRNVQVGQNQSNNPNASVPAANKRSGFWFHGIRAHHKSSKVKYPPGVPNISCFACHGDYSDLSKPLSEIKSGGLHGANYARGDQPNTSPVHFLNGFAIEMFSSDEAIAQSSGTVSCGDYDYMVDGVSVGCDKHSSLQYTRRSIPPEAWD